jgi:hypothetical protein
MFTLEMEPTLTSMAADAGAFTAIRHGELECRFAEPVGWIARPHWREGQYVCALSDPALATRLRDSLNHGRGATAAGAVKSLGCKLLRLVARPERCPPVLNSLVEYVGPTGFSGRVPLTEMLQLAVLAQFMCCDPRRFRPYLEVVLRAEPAYAPALGCPTIRLDAVLLDHRQPDGRPIQAIGVEIKSSRADFTADRKHASYRGRVDRLYFATLPGVVRPEELPHGVGLLELRREPDSSGFFEVVTPAWEFAMDPLSRYDLMYGLAVNNTPYRGGLELHQEALNAVDAYWAERAEAAAASPAKRVRRRTAAV